MQLDDQERDVSLLEVTDLMVRSKASSKALVDGISFSVNRGETVALVGESGSGKSLTAKAIAGLIPAGLETHGSIRRYDTELLRLSERELRAVRGSGISMLLQDPFTLLNPLSRIRTSMSETTASGPRARVRQEIEARLAEVGIDSAAGDKYPWELSGGMRQRVGLAASIIGQPGLLIADEPTTALDATTQREVLQLIRQLQISHEMALLMITHDLRVAMSMADRLLIMSEGRIVEVASPDELRRGAREIYTKRLLAAELPLHGRLDDLRVDSRLEGRSRPVGPAAGGGSGPRRHDGRTGQAGSHRLLRVDNVRKHFGDKPDDGDRQGWALNGVSFEMQGGRSLGIIGESGSGKTTLGRCVLGLETPTSGCITIADDPSQTHRPASVQCVFQDPYSSLNPAHTVGFTLREAIRHRGGDGLGSAEQQIRSMIESVGLPGELVGRRPATLSGGQRQRIAIARALLLEPHVLVCDEPVAALDLSVQSQVLHVLRQAQANGVAILMITHDVSVARQMTDDLLVLHQGMVVESGTTDDVINRPQHEYTRRLLEAVPTARSDWLGEPVRAT